ncbi:hypothetical protein VE03_04140 [Pseudogymnoascus sp. 23342-1-I1]|nr:hypothetical protein VE03_04140 [Pseudogymnoascus sp. 23342-1-I1]
MSSLARSLAKSRFEIHYDRLSEEASQAAADASSSRTYSPPPRSPIVVSRGSLISSAEKLQQLASLSTLPTIETTMTAPKEGEDLDAPPADDRKVQISDIDQDQENYIKDVTEGESISVWFKGTRRDAWVAKRLKQKIPWRSDVGDPQLRFPIIICQDGLFSTAEELQQFANLPMLPEIETTMIVPMNYDDADGPPVDSKEVQICGVDEDKRYSIGYITRGESVNVWFKG